MNTTEYAYLIVNADDYGYFHGVSRGILKAAADGIVTATGVLSNMPHFSEHAAWLRDQEALDVGIHLNLTARQPLTLTMRKALSRWAGAFPGKFTVAMAVLSGAIKPVDVRAEWEAQIERCLSEGLRVRFLNSHEHIHMLPALFTVTHALAKQYAVPHVRFPTPNLVWNSLGGAPVRDALMKILGSINRRGMNVPSPHFLGMDRSGKLDLPYLKKEISKLRPGKVYELMCHPGFQDNRETVNSSLARYHDWEGELNALTSPVLKHYLHEQKIRLIGYRHMEVVGGQLTVAHEAH